MQRTTNKARQQNYYLDGVWFRLHNYTYAQVEAVCIKASPLTAANIWAGYGGYTAIDSVSG